MMARAYDAAWTLRALKHEILAHQKNALAVAPRANALNGSKRCASVIFILKKKTRA
jgi:hypothetical protein